MKQSFITMDFEERAKKFYVELIKHILQVEVFEEEKHKDRLILVDWNELPDKEEVLVRSKKQWQIFCNAPETNKNTFVGHLTVWYGSGALFTPNPTEEFPHLKRLST